MNYIKFDTIESTNDFLKSYVKKNKVPDFFYVYAEEQTKGRGQRSNVWKSDCCKNILISYFIAKEWDPQKQYLLNQIVSISVAEILQKFNIPDIKIKEPNDILAGRNKICGILIENVISKNKIKQSIIGIGLNVNQEKFPGLAFATSLKKITGKHYDREQLMDEISNSLKKNFVLSESEIQKKYKPFLFRPSSQKIDLKNES